MILLLGFVALSHMQTNLLPDISTPYLMVVTVYPGASRSVWRVKSPT